ncbi:hypothetical protein ACWDBD_35545 [Streptomyces sp. NPDC001118]
MAGRPDHPAVAVNTSGENDAVRTFYAMDDAVRAVVQNLRGVIDLTSGRR